MGQKSSEVYALDPDREGTVVWKKRLGTGGLLGGIQWGFAADDRSVYFPLSDVVVIDEPGKPGRLDPKKGGGLFALDLATGAERWHAPPSDCGARPQCSPAQSQATTVVPGAVFSGAMDGVMRAFSTEDGRLLWSFDTVRNYKTVTAFRPGVGRWTHLARLLPVARCSSHPATRAWAGYPATCCSP